MIKVKTLSGRELNPPSIRVETNRKAVIDCKKADNWLLEESIKEAGLRKDDFNTFQFKNLNRERLSQADKECMHIYLFGDIKPIFELV